MNMKKKFLSVLQISLFIVIMMTMTVNAASFTATMTPSATTVKESTEFTITIKVSNLDVGTNGINSLEGYLKYDTSVFENISESSIEGLNSWSAKFDETNGKISLTKNTFVTSAQEVFQITFKTKSGVSGKSGTISYSDIVAGNSETNISATDISTSITIGNTADQNPSNTTNNTVTINAVASGNNTTNNATINSITNTNTNAVNNTNTNNTVSSYVNTMTNTTSGTDMPDTGVNDTVLIAIFSLVAIAIGFYIKIEKLNKDMK